MDFNFGWFICVGFVVLVGQIYFLGRKMSQPEEMICPIVGGLQPQHEKALSPYQDWLAAENFEFRSYFKFGAICVVVFQQRNTPRFFSFLFHQKLTFDIESYLEDLTILDTANSGKSGLFPRPGAYLQSFPGVSPQEGWRRHLEGEAHLSKKFGYSWKPLAKPYDQLLSEAMRLRMKYNRSQPFWPLRVLYRYFVTRHLINNKTMAQQFP